MQVSASESKLVCECVCGDVNRRSSNRERERENEQTNERTKDRSSTHHMTQKTDWEKERVADTGRQTGQDRTGITEVVVEEQQQSSSRGRIIFGNTERT